MEETALRETCEEIGLSRSLVDVWTKGPVLGRENLLITPFLGYLGEMETDKLKLNKSEVSFESTNIFFHFTECLVCICLYFPVYCKLLWEIERFPTVLLVLYSFESVL